MSSTSPSPSPSQTITGFLNHYTHRFFQGKVKNWNCVYCVFDIRTGLFQIFHMKDLKQTPDAQELFFEVKIEDVEIKDLKNEEQDGFEIVIRKFQREIFTCHESSYDIDLWENLLRSVQSDLRSGKIPRRVPFLTHPEISLPSSQSSTTAPSSNHVPPEYENVNAQQDFHMLNGRRKPPSMNHASNLLRRFERFTVYETSTRLYLVGSDRYYSKFRLLHFDRTIHSPANLGQILELDHQTRNWEQMEAQLQFIDSACRLSGQGPLERKLSAVALLGFVKFLQGYYIILVTKRRKIGCLGGNYIYGIESTQQLSISSQHHSSRMGLWDRMNTWLHPSQHDEAEARYLGLFHFLDLTKDFYFSYSYDLTRSLQQNMTSMPPNTNSTHSQPAVLNEKMFMWNHFLTEEFQQLLRPLGDEAQQELIQPLVYGSYEQRKCAVFGRLVSIILMARRSRHFAGTRYLKRGIADTGKVANDVEIEQIVEDESMGEGQFSSFVQYRGSIPIFWTQETSVTIPKPPIVLNRVDPTYSATRKHFADLFQRYGSPIIVLNLVKQTEKREREVIVGSEFRNAVEFINSAMPKRHRIRYIALDYSRISKQKDSNVLQALDEVALWSLRQTGFFCSAPKRHIKNQGHKYQGNSSSFSFDFNHTSTNTTRPKSYSCVSTNVEDPGPPLYREKKIQNLEAMPIRSPTPPTSPTLQRYSGEWLEQRGVLRVNCIDCLDRTNVGQFSVGMRAFGQQLYCMGLRNTPTLESRSQLIGVLMHLYSTVGDALSLQYGGSEAHKNVKNGPGNESNVKHRELLTSIRRYYSNSFTDMVKQDAINLFLGHFQPEIDQLPLWELDSDYYLHNFAVKQGFNMQQLPARISNPFQKENEKGNHKQANVLHSSSNASNERDPMTKEDIELARARRKKRKEELKESARISSAWWIAPLQKFDADKVIIDARAPAVASEDRFLRMYHTQELTYFDKELAYDFMTPVDLSRDSKNASLSKNNSPSDDSTTPFVDEEEQSYGRQSSAVDQTNTFWKPSDIIGDAKAVLASAVDNAATIPEPQSAQSQQDCNADEDASEAKFAASMGIDLSSNRTDINPDFIGNCVEIEPPKMYEDYVNISQLTPSSLSREEQMAETWYSNVYLKDFEIDPENALAVRDAQKRWGATYTISPIESPNETCDQNVFARQLVPEGLNCSSESERVYDQVVDLTHLTAAPETIVSKDTQALYQSFFNAPLMNCDDTSTTMEDNTNVSAVMKSSSAILMSRQRSCVEGVMRMPALIEPIGPLFRKLGGEAENAFVLFNDSAVEHHFGEEVKTEPLDASFDNKFTL